MKTNISNFIDKAKVFFHRSRREVIKTTVIGKTMIEESQLETKKRALFKELGELAFSLNRSGKLKNKEIEAFCKKINDILSRIDEKESTIDSVKSGKQSADS